MRRRGASHHRGDPGAGPGRAPRAGRGSSRPRQARPSLAARPLAGAGAAAVPDGLPRPGLVAVRAGLVVAHDHHPCRRQRRPGHLHLVPALDAVRARARARPAGRPPPELPRRREPHVEHLPGAAGAGAGAAHHEVRSGAHLQRAAGARLRPVRLVRLSGDPPLRAGAPGGGRRRADLRLLAGRPHPAGPSAHVAGVPGPADAAAAARDPRPPAPPAVAGRRRPRPARRLRGRIVHTLVAFVTAGVVFAAIAAWPLSVQFTGPQRIQGDIQERNRSNDLQGYVVPSTQQAIAPEAAAEQVRKFAGGNSAYLGVPLLLVLVVIGVRWWRNAVVRVTLALLLVSAVLSLGPRLLVGGRDTGIWLPVAYLERLPLLDSLIPSRLAQLTALFAGLLLALFLHAVWHGGGWRRFAAPAVGLLVLAPLWPASSIPAQKVATPAFFTSASVRELPRDGVTLVLPFPNRRIAVPMTWQAESDLWFRMAGGYFIGPQPDGRPRFDTNPRSGSQVFSRIYGGRPPPPLTKHWRLALARDFVRWRVGSVVVGPMPNQAVMVGFLTDLLGAQPEKVGGVYLWRDPK